MIYALLIFENPTQNEQIEWQNWQTLLNNHITPNIANERIQRIAQNAFLLHLQNVLPVFGDILSFANQHNLVYRSLFFEKEPNFSPPCDLGFDEGSLSQNFCLSWLRRKESSRYDKRPSLTIRIAIYAIIIAIIGIMYSNKNEIFEFIISIIDHLKIFV